MFLFLSKTLPLLLYPPGLTVILLLLSALVRKRRKDLATLLSFTAVLSLLVLSAGAVAESLLSSLESQYAPIALDQVPREDAIVVLGGYLRTPTQAHPIAEMEEPVDRLWMAARLFHAGKAPLVLVTGGSVQLLGQSRVPEALVAKDLLIQWGVPRDAIVIEERSQNTRQNAEFSAPILAQKSAKRLILVTSAYHMPRAVAIFRHLHLDVTPFPTDFQAGWGEGEFMIRWLPDAEHLFRSKLALKEWIGLEVYRLRGWA